MSPINIMLSEKGKLLKMQCNSIQIKSMFLKYIKVVKLKEKCKKTITINDRRLPLQTEVIVTGKG